MPFSRDPDAADYATLSPSYRGQDIRAFMKALNSQGGGLNEGSLVTLANTVLGTTCKTFEDVAAALNADPEAPFKLYWYCVEQEKQIRGVIRGSA